MAELIECPLMGNWGYDTTPEEGSERQSEFRVYKSHHQYEHVWDASENKVHKIIYIIRDPRDIVISSKHYFDLAFEILPGKFKKHLVGKFLNALSRRISRVFLTDNYKKKRMINMVLNGDKRVNEWCSVSWKEHHHPYHKNDVLFIKYEDLLSDPVETCNSVLNALDLYKSKAHIVKSIKNQSFSERKRIESNSKLLRTGHSGYWMEEFSDQEKDQFINCLGHELNMFDYTT